MMDAVFFPSIGGEVSLLGLVSSELNPCGDFGRPGSLSGVKKNTSEKLDNRANKTFGK